MASSSSSPTAGYRLHHTMYRVQDKDRSIDFYTRLLGMKMVVKRDFPNGKFTLMYFTYLDDATYAKLPPESDTDRRWEFMFSLKTHLVELTWNWEHPADFPGYRSGNEPEHKGFGHICIVVPDVYKAVDRLRAEGVKVRKGPDDGTMKGIAFVEDPDGYWVEIVKEGYRNV